MTTHLIILEIPGTDRKSALAQLKRIAREGRLEEFIVAHHPKPENPLLRKIKDKGKQP